MTLDPAIVEAFRSDGAVALRGVFAPRWIEALRRGVEANLASPGPYAKEYTAPGQAGRFFGDYCNWARIPDYQDFALRSPAASIARDLMGAAEVRLFHEHVLVKEPGTAEPTPWHHDLPYYGIEGGRGCSLWVPLDPVAREVCVEYVAGSHLWGRLFKPRRFVDQAEHSTDEAGLEPVPDIEGDRAAHRLLGWDLEPGDCIAFDFATLHGAPGNASGERRRRAAAFRYVDGATRFRRRPFQSPPFPEVDLPDGAPLDHASFPLVIGANP